MAVSKKKKSAETSDSSAGKTTKRRGCSRKKQEQPEETPQLKNMPVEDEILFGAGTENSEESSNNSIIYSYTGFLNKENDTLVIDVNKLYADLGITLQNIVGQEYTGSYNEIYKSNITFNLSVKTDDKNISDNKCLLINSKTFDIFPEKQYYNLFGTIGGSNISASNLEIQLSKLLITVFCTDFSWLDQYDNKVTSIELSIQGISDLDHGDENLQKFKKSTIIVKINISQNTYQYDIWENGIQPISNDRCSYALLRTNPKLTGNIKFVVDSNYNLYLDTFKISKNLSNNKYRKIPVSTEGNYPRDIRQAFKTLPKGDLFKIPETLLNPHKIYNNLTDQYVTTYEYGCETNSDFLYPENFRMLAPLWINDILPDFFCIFKLDDFYNKETYNIDAINYDDTEKFKQILKDCELIKVFDLRDHTPIGIYLNNYKEKYFIPRNVFLQFSKYNHDLSENESEIPLGKNTWTGISMDTGVIASKNEICYYGNKIINNGTQEEFNAYMIEGYERNNMVIPNLINFEFLFDDLGSEDYIMHRYFGLYLKQNELIEFAAITKSEKSGKISLIKYDNDYNEISDEIYDTLVEQYPDHLFFGESGNKVDRLKSSQDKQLFFLKNSANAAGNNILSSSSQFRGTENVSEFITINMKKPMEYGEHMRIITPGDEFEEEKYIFEIIASNDPRLLYTDGYISPYILYNQKGAKNLDNTVYIKHKYEDGIPENPKQEKFYTGDEWENSNAFTVLENLKFKYEGSNAEYVSGQNPEEEFSEDTGTDLPANTRNNEYIDIKYKFTTISKFPKVFRLCFYSQSTEDPESPASVYEQINRIERCIQKFNYKFYMASKTTDSFSIISACKNTAFQHITKDILDIDYDSDLIIEIGNDELSDQDKESYNKLYDSKKSEDPTFSYFNKQKYISEIYPLSFDTNGYTQETCMYAPLDFELLGWRKSSIVNFIPIGKYVYEVDIPETSKDYFDHIISVKGLNNKFNHLKKFSIDKNAVIQINDSVETLNSTYLYTSSNEILYIQSPYNLNKWIVQSDDPIAVINGHINFYIPKKSSISLMGILPLKDFDYMYSDQQIQFSSVKKIEAGANDVLYINDFYRGTFLTNQIYFLESGEFEDIRIPEHGYFIIYNTENNTGFEIAYKNQKEYIPYNYIRVKRPCVISRIDLNDLNISRYSEIINGLKIENYYKDLDPNADLNWPITLPVIFNWESINSEYLNIKYITNYSSEFVNYQKFLHNINNIVQIKSKDNSFKYDSWKNIILNHLIDNPLYTYLSTLSDSLKFRRKVIYNEYINSITFIYNQFLFKISLSNTIYNKNINLYKYNNYDFYLIIDFEEYSAKNELYISEDESIILYIIHNFDFKKYQQINEDLPHNSTLFNDSNFENWISWNWRNSSFDIDNTSIFGTATKIAGDYTGNLPTNLVDNNTAYSKITYIDYNDNNINLFSNLMNEQLYIRYKNDDYNTDTHMFRWNNQYIYSYLDDNNPGKFGEFDSAFNKNTKGKSLLINYIQKYSTPEFAAKSKTEQENIKYEEFKNACLNPSSTDIYILKNKNYLLYTQSEINTVLDINITYIKPEIPLKYHNEYFIPRFKDIIYFNENEVYDIIEQTKLSYFMGNTNIKSVNRIPSNYVNMVYLEKYNNERVQYNYIENGNQSILSSSWDRRFYRIINKTEEMYYVDGFVPGIETKNYFGSAGIVLNDPEIHISNWTKNTISFDFAITKYSESNKNINANPVDTDTLYDKPKTSKSINFNVNITEALYSYFKSESLPLYTNWTNFIGADKDNSYNNYIKTTLLKYFNINDKNNVKVYSYLTAEPVNTNELINYTEPEDFYKYTIEKNIDIEYKSIDNSLIAIISMPYTQNKKYYISVNIKSI